MQAMRSEDIVTVISRALNLIDSRLIDHGVRVMLVLDDMLSAEGCGDPEKRKDLHILALLHDVGAYRTEQVLDLVRFEVRHAWEHSAYGYLFLREFTPLGDWAEVVLYHHADCAGVADRPEHIRRYAQMLHLADRAVIWHDEVKGTREGLQKQLAQKRGRTFSGECIDLFLRADRQFHTLEKLDAPIPVGELVGRDVFSEEEAKAYLGMVSHTIDFRSRVTVAHTVSVMEIGTCLAQRLGLSPEETEQIRYGGLLHDLGKIGIPLSILEKPDKLTEEEMNVMREHVVLTGRILEGCVDERVARIAGRHHEKLDGSGYPLGLSAAELTMPERVLAVADVASALCMRRSYKEPFPRERCLAILEDMRDRGHLDGDVVGAMSRCYDGILTQADAACAPVWEAYERIQRDYGDIIEARRGRAVRAAALSR